MNETEDLAQRYRDLEATLPMRPLDEVRADLLLTFPYPEDGVDQEISIDTDEFTAVCPWTGLPDYGTLIVQYRPRLRCLDLKSFKYYLLSYRDVGVVQEHATDRILRDLVVAVEPWRMSITLDYKIRGGLHTLTTAQYPAEK